jgi:uncharacterized zinc-type alcohol dehydrogenase-like protein
MVEAIGYSASGPKDALKPRRFTCDEPGAHDIRIAVMFCGVCHSDIHQVKNEWGNTVYPCMPGHEVVGRVASVGSGVTLHKVGDIVGVGCMIDSCRECEACRAGEENYCIGPNSWLATYNGPMVPAAKAPGGRNTYGRDNTFGGYSTTLVVKEDFALKIPENLPPEKAAPILCAGVTTYSPMKHWGVKAGDQVGIVGYGGLGNIAGKIAKALGAHVTVFTTSAEKRRPAESAGVDRVVLEDDKESFEKLAGKFDFILSTVPQKHDINPFVALLKRDSTLTVVGALEPLEPMNNMPLAFKRRSVAGSLIGSIAETQEVLDFCARHDVTPDVQVISIEQINDAFERVENGEVRFRYVIDMESLR